MAFDGRPYSNADIHSSKIFSGLGCWVYKRKKCNINYREPPETKEKLHRSKVSGKGVSCFYSWKRLRDNKELYSTALLEVFDLNPTRIFIFRIILKHS